MNLRWLLFICVEIHKIANRLNPSSMRYAVEIRKSDRLTCDAWKFNLKIARRNQLNLVVKVISFTDQKIETLYN